MNGRGFKIFSMFLYMTNLPRYIINNTFINAKHCVCVVFAHFHTLNRSKGNNCVKMRIPLSWKGTGGEMSPSFEVM